MEVQTLGKATNKKLELELMKELGLKSMLKLTLDGVWFDIMVTGQKGNEFRKPSEWMMSRLFTLGKKRDYDLIKFSHGYQKGSAWFICEYKGFFFAQSDHSVKYGNLVVHVSKGDIVIKLGQILKVKEADK